MICNFATRWFCTLAMALVHAGGLDSFGINQKRQVNLYKGYVYVFFLQRYKHATHNTLNGVAIFSSVASLVRDLP